MRMVALLLAAFGTWKVVVAGSTFAGETHLRALTVTIEWYAKDEVTLDRVETHRRTVSSGSMLYLDNEPRGHRRISGVPESSCHGEWTAAP
jgi:hypothetical protein